VVFFMKITLCYPSLLPGQKPKYGLQPLGVLYIAAVLKHNGFDVSVVDADVDGLTVEEIVERCLAEEPDLVGFSAMTPQLITALQAAALIKQTRPETVVVLGGAHFDSTHEDTYEMADCFDFIVYGEGEYPLLEVAQSLDEHGREHLHRCLEGVGNVIFKNADGNIVKNERRPFLTGLDDLPTVDYDMIDVQRYSIPTMAGRYVISMMLSRGCPFRCTFCDAPITMGKKLRFWSLERIIKDLKFLVEKYDCHNFVFKDSTFTANQKWAHRFCDAVLEAGLKIKWRCNTRVNLVPPDLLNKMAKAGCYVINFGVESGNPGILKRIHKECAIEDVYDAHERCRKLGIRTYATFLMGNPGETDQTAQETIDVACGIRPSLAMFFVNTAYPGTPLYDEAVSGGFVEPRWWATRDVWDPTKNSAFEARWGWTSRGGLNISGFDAEKWQKKATRSFYFRKRFIWDTLVFTLRNPYFLRHLINLGTEMLPFYKLTMKLPWKRRQLNSAMQQEKLMARCPSAPHAEYQERAATGAHQDTAAK
jgi:radical SAM superfamily enzyme YgiQ (UPF0313 family)